MVKLLLHAEPEEEQPVAATQPQRQQASSPDGEQGMQIEDVSLQESQPNSDRSSDAKETGATGVMQSVMGAAKSLFGGHANEVSYFPLLAHALVHLINAFAGAALVLCTSAFGNTASQTSMAQHRKYHPVTTCCMCAGCAR